jgi:hypothetical protein
MTHMTGHSHLRSVLLVAIGFAALACSATALRATVILPNLPPGTQYEILFVTLDPTAATSTDITTYNTFAAHEANLSPAIAALHLSWNAVASTAAVDAIVNAPDNGIAVYNTQGIELATAATGIYNGDILEPVQFNQFGNSEATFPATGANPLGGATAEPMGTALEVTLGRSTVPNGSGENWLDASFGPQNTTYPIYALSLPITAPEPATIAMLGWALLTIGGMQLVRWRALHK